MRAFLKEAFETENRNTFLVMLVAVGFGLLAMRTFLEAI